MTTGGLEAVSAPARRWVLALTSVASLMVVLDALVVSTALPVIRVRLGASLEELGWTVKAYTLSFAVLLMPAAAVGGRLGRRQMFTAGLGLFIAASAACALATSPGWLISARTVQGAGAALVMPHALALLSGAFPPRLRPKALGMFAAVTWLAVPLGPLLGGAVDDQQWKAVTNLLSPDVPAGWGRRTGGHQRRPLEQYPAHLHQLHG